MKCNLFISLLAILIFNSCINHSSIEYYKTVNAELGNLKKENAYLSVLLVFKNISEDQFIVKDLVLDFKIDGKDIGTILVKNPKEVRPHSEFAIPVKYMYETNRIVKAGEEPADVYLIQLEGDLTLKDKNGEEVTVPVQYKASYVYKTTKEERIEKRQERKEERKKEKEVQSNN